MDYKEFSAKIKAKYPQYSDMNDRDLAQKMVSKYPQYSDITFDEDSQTKQPQERSILQQVGSRFNAATEENKQLKQPFRAIANVSAMAAAPFDLAMSTAGSLASDLVPKGAKTTLSNMVNAPAKYNNQMTDRFGQPMGTLPQAMQGAVQTFERQPLTLRKMEEAALNIPMAGSVIKGLGKQIVKNIPQGTKQAAIKEVEKLVTSQKGAVEIPDLGAETRALENAMGSIGEAGNPILSAKSVNKFAEKTPSIGPLEKLAGVNDREATILNVKTDPTDVPFTDYAIQAKKSIRGADIKTGAPIPTPLDLVGKRGVEAHGKIDEIRKIKGAEKADYLQTIDDAIVSTNSFVNPQNLKNTFKKELEGKLGLYVDDMGNIKTAATGARNEALIPEAKKVVEMLDRMPDEMTAQQLDALSANLRGFLTKRKASELKPSRDQIDIIVTELRNGINKELEIKASELLTPQDFSNYIKAKRDYANIKTIEEELSKALGREVIPGSDIASRGASIAKRMVQSNADAGSKALAVAVKKLTGIDLFKEANYAEIAMRAVGDARAESLLQQGVQGAISTGPKSAALGALQKSSKKLISGEKIDRLIDYYNRKQAKAGYKYMQEKAGSATLKTIGKGKLQKYNPLTNERGSIGGGISENPQIHSDNFKQWFGDWKNAPEQASKVVDESGKPLVVYHGTNNDFTEFDTKKVGSNYKDIGYKRGFFFARNADEADVTMFDIPSGAANIKPAYLSLKKPYIVKMTPGDKIPGHWASANSATVWYDNNAKQIMKSAASRKSDGIIIENTIDPNDKIYIAFHPNQIKSATGNSGAFSKLTNDIRGNTGLKMLAGTSAAGLGGITLAAMANKKKGK